MAFEKRPMEIDDLFRLRRVVDPQLSPSGTQVVYQLTEIIDAAKNFKKTQLWMSEISELSSRQITYSGKSDTHPRWSPDGSRILFD